MAFQAKRASSVACSQEGCVRIAVDIMARGALHLAVEERNASDHQAAAGRRDQAAIGGRQCAVIGETDRVIVPQVSAKVASATDEMGPRLRTEAIERYRAVVAGQAKLRRTVRLAGRSIEGRTHRIAVELKSLNCERMIPQLRSRPGVVRDVAENADLSASPPSARQIVRSTRDLGEARQRGQQQRTSRQPAQQPPSISY